MRWREIRAGLAAQRAHAHEYREMLREMRGAETSVEQTRARWEAGQPVRSAARLAVLVTGHDYQAAQQRQAADPDHVNMAAWEMEHAAEIRAWADMEAGR